MTSSAKRELHDFRCVGGGGGWSVSRCARCGVEGFGGCWWQQLLARALPKWFGCHLAPELIHAGQQEEIEVLQAQYIDGKIEVDELDRLLGFAVRRGQ
jgi:hypothetical protein